MSSCNQQVLRNITEGARTYVVLVNGQTDAVVLVGGLHLVETHHHAEVCLNLSLVLLSDEHVLCGHPVRN